MSKIRVHELAKKIGVANQDVIAQLSKLGVKVKTPSSGIEAEVAEKVEKAFKTPQKKPAAPAKTPIVQRKRPPVQKKTAEVLKKATDIRKETPVVQAPQPSPPVQAKAEAVKTAEEPEIKSEPEPLIEEVIADDTAIIIDETEISVPDRFKKEIEVEKVEKFKAKPAMQRAFQAVRKVEPRKWQDAKTFRRIGREKPAQKTDEKLQPQITAPRKKFLKMQEGTTVKEFAELISVKSADVIKKFMELGYMPTINQPVDMDAALLVAEGFGVKLEISSIEEEQHVMEEEADDAALQSHRPPVVTIMGHVDHGKTSLLDAIRETKVTETEAGGITQHIGAYKIKLKGKEIVFLDTPGHEAFTSLRARGAKVTDIVVLVVAADDGVMPQTVEAIDHAKAANVPIVVAVNKIDKQEANPTKVRNELSERGIISEEWGGNNIFVEVSAKKRIGIERLLEMILLQAEIMELKANPNKMAKGTIIEARLDRGRGPVATVLVQNGTLKVGDIFLSGSSVGKVRALIDDTGKRINEAVPSTPVEVIGFSEVPTAGDIFNQVGDEKKARQIALIRQQKQRHVDIAKAKKLTLDDLYAKIKEGEIKDLNIIIKGDVQGSVEALKEAFEQIAHPEVKVKVIHASVGGINESDVMLAAASNAIIIGFNVRPEAKAHQMAEKEGVDIRHYNIIYIAIDDIKKALEGMLAPTLKEKILGRAEVRQTYSVSRIGTIAGSYVVDGLISRASDGIRLIRDNIVVHEGRISSLKRFKDDVKEVQAGYECGITIESYNDIKVGDIIENYVIEKIAGKL
jgi:translation initiation factor IF-2